MRTISTRVDQFAVLRLSYQEGLLDVIDVVADVDMLLVDGNPLENIDRVLPHLNGRFKKELLLCFPSFHFAPSSRIIEPFNVVKNI